MTRATAKTMQLGSINRKSVAATTTTGCTLSIIALCEDHKHPKPCLTHTYSLKMPKLPKVRQKQVHLRLVSFRQLNLQSGRDCWVLSASYGCVCAAVVQLSGAFLFRTGRTSGTSGTSGSGSGGPSGRQAALALRWAQVTSLLLLKVR